MADDIMRGTQKFLSTVTTYITEYLIHVINSTCGIGTAHNGFGFVPIHLTVYRGGVLKIWYHIFSGKICHKDTIFSLNYKKLIKNSYQQLLCNSLFFNKKKIFNNRKKYKKKNWVFMKNFYNLHPQLKS